MTTASTLRELRRTVSETVGLTVGAHLARIRREHPISAEISRGQSYTRSSHAVSSWLVRATFALVMQAPPGGFEPPTHGLGNRCSIP